MRESESSGVKKLSAEGGKFDFANLDLQCCAIEVVSDERMLECGEVYANLMRSAGVELDFDERGGA